MAGRHTRPLPRRDQDGAARDACKPHSTPAPSLHHLPSTSSSPFQAAPYLALLSPTERAAVLKFLFPRDAKLSLASSLIKRLAISTTTLVPWSSATPARDDRGKPVFADAPGRPPLRFNVSHQDGLVALLGVTCEADVGIDVVSCGERRVRDRETVARDGWAAFVRVYEDVFSPREVSYLISLEAEGLGVDERFRFFYALWCLREAYVKMTGEALLAEWLKDLEFRNFRPPRASGGGGLEPGEVVTDIEFARHGKIEEGVRMELRALGEGYMVGTAVRTRRAAEVFGLGLDQLEIVTLEDIRAHAERNP